MPSPSELRPIRKKLVTDEQHRPVAVQIDYADWLEIERRLGLSRQTSETSPEGFDRLLAETSGIWTEGSPTPSLQELADRVQPHWQGGDGLEFQRRLRDEWTRPWDPEAQEGA